MELSDLPTLSAAAVVESAPLWVVSDMVSAGHYDLVVVLRENDSVRGVVQRDAVVRLAARVPEAPMKMVPMRRALVVAQDTAMEDAMALLREDDVEALLIERGAGQGYAVLTRDDLESVDEPLAAAG